MSDLLKYEQAAKQEWSYFDKFASLLAEKQMNIVRSATAKTASIDLRTGSITIPFFSVEDKDMFLLFLSHEVSHALHTPIDWYAQHNREDNSSKQSERLLNICTNIVEDIRIEKLIRRKFPGFVDVYNRAYYKLLGMDFFSINRWEDFKIHDRINAHGKLGKFLQYNLSTHDLAVYKYLAQAETFDDVLPRARYLYELTKNELLNNDTPPDVDNDAEEGGCEDQFLPNEAGDISQESYERDESIETDESLSSLPLPTDNDSDITDKQIDEMSNNNKVNSLVQDAVNESLDEQISRDVHTANEYRPSKNVSVLARVW